MLAQLDVWMRAAGLRSTPSGAPDDGTGDPALRKMFHVDAERQLVMLRARVDGRRRNADAALLLLHGYGTCLGAGDDGEVPAVRLRASLAASGHRLQRLDRTLIPYVEAGLVRKAGGHRRETYALTQLGARRAKGAIPQGNSNELRERGVFRFHSTSLNLADFRCSTGTATGIRGRSGQPMLVRSLSKRAFAVSRSSRSKSSTAASKAIARPK